MQEVDYQPSDDELYMMMCQEIIPVYDEYYEVEGVEE